MASYEISLDPSQKMSPFPRRTRPFEDTLSGSSKAVPLTGKTIPDLARLMYGTSTVHPYSDLRFGFIKRDLKNTTYRYGSVDPFVMKDAASAETYFKSALELIEVINDMWQEFGLPLTMDADRGIKVPDTSSEDARRLMNDPDTPVAVKADLRLLAANADVLKKTALVRAIPIGWWVAAYDGQTSKNPAYLSRGVKAVVKAMLALRNHPVFARALDTTLASQGDPLWTSVGYPLYSAELTKEGKPLSKLKVLHQYKGLMASFPADAKELFAAVAARGTNDFEKQRPLAIASLRRSQQGYKWAHEFLATPTGLVARRDVRGLPTTRVAFQASYLQNLVISPIQSEWKTLRKLMPGLTFDGDDRRAVLKMIRESNPALVESDYSGYDRSIPYDVTLQFFKEYCAGLPSRQNAWYSLLTTTNTDLDLLWPDYAGENEAVLWAFKAKRLALLSGLKITSEMGTFMNLIINVSGWLNEGLMTETQVHDYLTISLRKPNWKAEIQPGDIKVLIQSDDELMILPDEKTARLYEAAFLKSADAAGVGAKIEIGDKFLSRHMTNGVDTPVIARVFQNTVSNETPTDDVWKFMMGLVARTDGLAGIKTTDPFATGARRTISAVERKLTHAMLVRLLKQCESAAIPVPGAISFLRLYRDALVNARKEANGYRVTTEAAHAIDSERNRVTAKFATLQLKEYDDGMATFQNSLLAELWAKKDSPAAALALEELLTLRPELRALLDSYVMTESNFYKYAMKELGHDLKIK